MLINRIALKNFKCFREVDIKLAPLTLLTGANSSGKSSLIYGILLPFQSQGFPFYLSPNGKYVNLGDFEEMAFKHDKKSEIGIEIHVNLYRQENVISTSWVIPTSHIVSKLNHSILENNILTYEAKYYDGHIISLYDEKLPENTKEYLYNVATNNVENIEAAIINITKNIPRIVILNLEGQFADLYLNPEMNFIGPFRHPPERTYYRKTHVSGYIGINGEDYIDQIIEWESQKSNKFHQLKKILKELGLVNTIKSRQLRGGRFELSVKTNSKSVWASLTDVGFGISQFLPIVVADLQLTDDSLLLLAQPEIHLHPSIQASLGDYFIKQIKTTEKQYVVETHSEYLLHRIRLRIVQGEIEPNDMAIYYFEPSPDGTITHQLEFTKDGQILNAPPGFFDTYMLDTMDIALNA